MGFNSKEVIEHDKKTAIGFHNGRWDYPSSKGLGVDTITYPRRNPHPTERTPWPTTVKMMDLKHLINRDLRDAARAGELRAELGRHIGLLEKNGYADAGTVKMLRGFESDLTGHPGCDADQLDVISSAIGTLGPKEA
jgi:hypothetical protein